MPNTQELLGIIKEDFAPDWGIPKLTQLLDRAQRYLMMNDCAQTVYLNRDDTVFPFPILSTTENNLKYDIDSTTLVDSSGNAVTPQINGYNVRLRRVRHLFIMVSDLASSNYDKKFYGAQIFPFGLNEYWSQRLYRVSYYKVPCDIREASGLKDVPHITFFENQGTHDDRIFVEAFYDPYELTDYNTPLSLDGNKWEEALIDGVVGYIEDMENGRSERLEKFRTYWKKQFMNEGNAHVDERCGSGMPIRACL